MASGEDLIKYITERVVAYIETPRKERHRQRQDKAKVKVPWHVRWFGILGVSLELWIKNKRKGKS